MRAVNTININLYIYIFFSFSECLAQNLQTHGKKFFIGRKFFLISSKKRFDCIAQFCGAFADRHARPEKLIFLLADRAVQTLLSCAREFVLPRPY